MKEGDKMLIRQPTGEVTEATICFVSPGYQLDLARAAGSRIRRRCRNRQPHEAHVWHGLNTKHMGYYCIGRTRS